MGTLSRRQFIARGAAGGAALALGGAFAGRAFSAGFGPLRPDTRGGLLDLPPGFRYRILSDADSQLSNGAPVPVDFDGMAVFRRGSATLIVRNHELSPDDATAGKTPVTGTNPWDPSAPGGTTAILLNPSGRKLREFVTSSGTVTNCAGGATPWGTWLTCEETIGATHGWVFEVDPLRPQSDLSKTPITGMGNFVHEAIDIDPSTGIAYLTEDSVSGPIPANPQDENLQSRRSFLYRYVPNDPSPRPGALQAGGTLQVLCLEDLDGYNADLANPGQSFGVLWKDVNPLDPHDDADVKGGVRFNRLEGCHFSGGAFWFDDTAGGEGRRGQVFRLIPSPGGDLLELFFEGATSTQADAPDNLVVTPWGDLWFAEDGGGTDRVMGITPLGEVYEFARNRLNSTEFTGPCFAPNGRTFFVNIQDPPFTFAVTGHFPHASQSAQRRMAAAAPPRALAPRVSGELAEAAERHGMTRLEAAAYDRLGVPLT